MISKVLFLSVLLSFFDYVRCYSVEVGPGMKECYSVAATTGMPCSGSYEVLAEDPKPLTISVKGPGPHHNTYYESKYQGEGAVNADMSEGMFSFDAETEGDYYLCIENGSENNNDGISRLVAFNFRTVSVGERDYQYNGVESELDELQQALDLLIDHQSFMNQREDVHKSSLESMNTKVLLWTVLETIILIGMAFWQISYISKFFETKRRL